MVIGARPVRVVSATSKAGVVIVGAVLVIVFGFLVGAEAGTAAGSVAASIGELALVVVCARIFRGEGESHQPARAWWRLTARATSARWVAALFAVSAAATWISVGSGEPSAAAAVTQTVVSLAFLGSALRQSRP